MVKAAAAPACRREQVQSVPGPAGLVVMMMAGTHNQDVCVCIAHLISQGTIETRDGRTLMGLGVGSHLVHQARRISPDRPCPIEREQIGRLDSVTMTSASRDGRTARGASQSTV